jgi:hypothetical protein
MRPSRRGLLGRDPRELTRALAFDLFRRFPTGVRDLKPGARCRIALGSLAASASGSGIATCALLACSLEFIAN